MRSRRRLRNGCGFGTTDILPGSRFRRLRTERVTGPEDLAGRAAPVNPLVQQA